MNEDLPYIGDVEAIEVAIEVNNEVLKSGKFPNGKKLSEKARIEMIKENEDLKRIADEEALKILTALNTKKRKGLQDLLEFVPTKSGRSKIHRNFKSEYPKTETIKIRISNQHLGLLKALCSDLDKSQSDMVCEALEYYGIRGTQNFYKIENSEILKNKF